jgi:hypothetical protein
MKKLALLLLALPLTACAHNQLIRDTLAHAEARCLRSPDYSSYLGCINRYAAPHDLEVHPLSDGSLTLVTIQGGAAAGPGPGPTLY